MGIEFFLHLLAKHTQLSVKTFSSSFSSSSYTTTKFNFQIKSNKKILIEKNSRNLKVCFNVSA